MTPKSERSSFQEIATLNSGRGNVAWSCRELEIMIVEGVPWERHPAEVVKWGMYFFAGSSIDQHFAQRGRLTPLQRPTMPASSLGFGY